MGAKDDSEKILREIHVLFAKAEPYEGSRDRVVVDKKQIFDLLDQLNDATNSMVDECELTWAERDKAYRRQKRQGDEIVSEARHKAEDVYAASVMYTDRSLEEIQDLVSRTCEELDEIHRKMKEAVGAELRHMRDNQTELHGQLRDMADSQKYLHLIEDENRRVAREKEKAREADGGGTFTPLSYAGAVPEIRVNPAYFERRAQMMAAEDKRTEEGSADREAEGEEIRGTAADEPPENKIRGENAADREAEARMIREDVLDASSKREAGEEDTVAQGSESKIRDTGAANNWAGSASKEKAAVSRICDSNAEKEMSGNSAADAALSDLDWETRGDQINRQENRVDKVLQIFRKSGNS